MAKLLALVKKLEDIEEGLRPLYTETVFAVELIDAYAIQPWCVLFRLFEPPVNISSIGDESNSTNLRPLLLAILQ